ncbi:MAG: hypothetical protein VYB15_10305 [Planctomycetota bacterium]|nr:hypothetical protein [Planctomycetota bacterium]
MKLTDILSLAAAAQHQVDDRDNQDERTKKNSAAIHDETIPVKKMRPHNSAAEWTNIEQPTPRVQYVTIACCGAHEGKPLI